MLLPTTLLLGLSCALPPSPAPDSSPSPASAGVPAAGAVAAWQKGQDALDADHLEEAVGQFEVALRLDPAFARARLGLAAAHMALGQDRQAQPQLAAYLQARPDHFLIRMPYAELLARLEDLEGARWQLERFAAAVQDNPRLAEEHLVACHTRLMEIAQRQGDEYGERLHRGIGLHLLAARRLEAGGTGASDLAEELLCKSAGELTLAKMLCPHEARPYWYLHLVWHALGQNHPAQRCLRAAERRAGLSPLTASEQCELQLRLRGDSPAHR